MNVCSVFKSELWVILHVFLLAASFVLFFKIYLKKKSENLKFLHAAGPYTGQLKLLYVYIPVWATIIRQLRAVHCLLYRGSYMKAHVLLNLLNKLGKRDQMRGLLSNLSIFRNKFNRFNNTRARMLDSNYHMTLRLL